MLPPAAQIRRNGFAVLLKTDGESLQYSTNGGTNAVEILAVVNRDETELKKQIPRTANFDFGALGMSMIEFFQGTNTQPVSGATFSDGIGFLHRVVYVKPTDFTWKAYCAQSQLRS